MLGECCLIWRSSAKAVFGAQVIVMVDIQLNDKDSSRKLLFWRAVSDLGIAMRFLMVHALNRMVCGVSACNIIDNGT